MDSVFITGAASGIGLATALHFAACGWRVAAADIDIQALRAELADVRGIDLLLQCDISSPQQIDAAMAEADAAFDGLTAVVANAGIHARDSVFSFTDTTLERIIDINIKGTACTLRAAARLMSPRKKGSIILTASDQAFIGKPGNFTYGLTKGAIAQMTRTAALELAPFGVRVNAVCPGTVATPFVDRIFADAHALSGQSLESRWAEERALFPLGRACEPEEVARAIHFLAADATFSTGSLLKIDGGLTAG